MNITGKLYAESPIYRGNGRKTLFTRDGDGRDRLVSLAGEIEGTAQSLMDAFIGESRNGRNIGLLNRLWQRLYNETLPNGLIERVQCQLNQESYLPDHFFDLRMGIKLDEDRWAAEANANYKMETVLRNSIFDLRLSVNDGLLKKGDNQARLYYLLDELANGRFWFGAGKSKGLGRLRLELDKSLAAPDNTPALNPKANHLRLQLSFDARNPVLVGWNWGKVDPDTPAFAAVEGRVLIGVLREIPPALSERLQLVLSGPILNPADWKQKLAEYLPRVTAVWLQEQSEGQAKTWTLPAVGVAKLGKGKYSLSKSLIKKLEPLTEISFDSEATAEAAINEAMAEKPNMAGRVIKLLESSTSAGYSFNREAWQEIATAFSLDEQLADTLAEQIEDEEQLTNSLQAAYRPALVRFNEQVDQQIQLLQSDAWVDAEISNRQQHMDIKQMLLSGKISESQWRNRDKAPDGVTIFAWREFLDSHNRVRFQHITHERNLRKSITNDRNMITFLQAYRNRTRQELAQPEHIDFRAGGRNNREISRKYGKSYDTIFMRMLNWKPGQSGDGGWEVYVPGSTIKGAFRKRASQVLKTLWGEGRQTEDVLARLFGKQGQVGLVFFSDAYLAHPDNPAKVWCSMDGVRMDPATGQPVESAKSDFLYGYGRDLKFTLLLDLQDVDEFDVDALSLFAHLLQDFRMGDVPIGGEKSSGLGWVEAQIEAVEWRTGNPQDVGQWLFNGEALQPSGLWHELYLTGEAAHNALQTAESLTRNRQPSERPFRTDAGFISHRAFGGYSGRLEIEVETLTPTHIQESGQPSYHVETADGHINGWDFFSMAPGEAALRGDDRLYALPSKSLRGMLRHIYAIASDSGQASPDIARLNPVDGLFGWVGNGQNQALMSRLAIGFAPFDNPQFSWFKHPYPYGRWQYSNGTWQEGGEANGAGKMKVAKTWRLFQNRPLAPIVQPLDSFDPDGSQANYLRAILPGSKAKFTLRFWNLEEEELQRLVWCVQLEDGLAHKIGKGRYLGLGSVRLRILPESFLIDWQARYGKETTAAGRQPLNPADWVNQEVVHHYNGLKKGLNAEQL